MHGDRLLLGPGPSNPYPEVMEAFQRPVLGHLDPDFLVVLDEIADMLRTVFRTANALTLPISGTGSAGMEACFVNLLEPGDTAIIGVNARNLRTFRVDPEKATRAIARIPDDRVAVYMSGVRDPEGYARVGGTRADAVLIGEGLMRAADPGAELRRITAP